MDAKQEKLSRVKDAQEEEENTEDVNIAVRTDVPTTNGYHTDDGSPMAKVPKLSIVEEKTEIDLTLNRKYTTKATKHVLKAQWNSNKEDDTNGIVDDVDAQVYTDPFQICLLPNLLQNKDSCNQLVNEMIENVQWSRKQMDLYEFYQSTDLSNMAECKLLTRFLQMLRRDVRPWLEKVTNLKLDYVSASCSMYTCGDFLLVHDDLLKDRQIAFIYYLSPWENAEQWTEEQGGCLEIFSSNEQNFPHFPVRRKISPRNNQFAFFKVGSRSFHQVGEVTTFDYPRLTINGWFHGASNEDLIADVMRPFGKVHFKPPKVNNDQQNILELMVNQIYLKSDTRKSIQKRIEDNSEICLYEFLRYSHFEKALEQLLNDESLKWRRQGPANAQNYEVLNLNTASGCIAQLISFFSNQQIFELLRDYTDLDLAGPNAATPSYTLEVQRWSHGNYTMLGDGAISEENTLDLIYYLNAADGAGIITYLSPEAEQQAAAHSTHSSDATSDGGSNDSAVDGDKDNDDNDDSVLLTITPVDNALNIVYRCEGTTKFTKYVSRNTPLEKGPVFIIVCSYKE